jgi:hypothetical protein
VVGDVVLLSGFSRSKATLVAKRKPPALAGGLFTTLILIIKANLTNFNLYKLKYSS